MILQNGNLFVHLFSSGWKIFNKYIFRDINTSVRIADADKSVLQEQAVVIVGAVADENLLVFATACSRSNFITASFLIKCCFYLDVGAVVQQIQVGGERAGVWLWGKAQQRWALHVHSPGVDGAPGPPQGAVTKDGLNGLRKQRLQRGEKASRRRKELPHVASLLPGLCFQRVGKKIHHFRLQTNWAGVGLW